MKTFEYCQINYNINTEMVEASNTIGAFAQGKNFITVLNIVGKDGWELVASLNNIKYDSDILYCKRVV